MNWIDSEYNEMKIFWFDEYKMNKSVLKEKNLILFLVGNSNVRCLYAKANDNQIEKIFY
jgi:hypothetical protein